MTVPVGVGDVLAEAGELTVRRLGRASTWQRTHGGTIERALLSTGAVSESVLTSALSQAYGLPGVTRETLLTSDPDVVDAVPARERRRLRAIPFETKGKRLSVVVSDPRNPVLLNVLEAVSGFSVDLHVAPDPVIEDALAEFEKPPAERAKPAAAPAAPRTAGDESIERLARALLAEALRFGATEMVLGVDSRGGFVRTFDATRPAITRRLSDALLGPLDSWFQSRCGRNGGMVVESDEGDGRRRVTLVKADDKGVALRIAPAEAGARLTEPGVARCTHEGTKGFVFCPRCGEAL